MFTSLWQCLPCRARRGRTVHIPLYPRALLLPIGARQGLLAGCAVAGCSPRLPFLPEWAGARILAGMCLQGLRTLLAVEGAVLTTLWSEGACSSAGRGSARAAQDACAEGKAERLFISKQLFKALLTFQDPHMQPVAPLYLFFSDVIL